jgi:phytoene dehydrogenase-like protein
LAACAEKGLLYQIWRSFKPHGWLSRLTFSFMAKRMTGFSHVTASSRLSELFTSPRLKALLAYMTYGCCGVGPDEVQFSLVTGLHHHFSGGASYPVKGPQEIARAMVRQIEIGGGKVMLRSSVDRILTDAAGDK